MVRILKIVGLSTSPRSEANTEYMVLEALSASKSFGVQVGCSVETELISLAKKTILPCRHCDSCIRQKSYCVIKDDWLSIIDRLINPAPDGLIVGSPVYFFHINSLGRAFMERCTCLLKKRWDQEFPHNPPDFSRAAGGAIAVGTGRNSGIEHTMSDILDWLLMMGFVVVGGLNIGGGGWTQEDTRISAINKDLLGLEAARLVGQKVAKTALLLKQGAASFGKELPIIP